MRWWLVLAAFTVGLIALAGCGDDDQDKKESLLTMEAGTFNIERLVAEGSRWLRADLPDEDLQSTVTAVEEELQILDDDQLRELIPQDVEIPAQPIDFTEPQLTGVEAVAFSLLQVNRFCSEAVAQLQTVLEEGSGPPTDEELAGEIADALGSCAEAKQIQGRAFDQLVASQESD